MIRKLHACLFLLALVALSLPTLAQDLENSPVPLPLLKRDFVQVAAVDRSGISLPTRPVATVDGHPLTQGDLLWVLLESNLSTIANVLLDNKMLECELLRSGIEVSEEELQKELAEILPRIAPDKTFDELVEAGLYSADYLRRTARTTHGWKKLVWASRNIPEANRDAQTVAFLLQLYKREITSRYQIMLRGRKPAPPEGAFAALSTLVKGKVVTYEVGPLEAMEFLLGVLRPSSIIQGRRQLIEDYLVTNAMAKAGVSVNDSEIEAYVREMQAKFQPPFSWDMVLQAKGLSQDQERVRWRNAEAWKRATGTEITKEKVLKFCAENEDHFRGRYVEVKHILIMTVDSATGMSLGDDAEAAAKAKALKVMQLIEEGVDFDRLAALYSDDKSSAESGGKLPQPVKKFGGALDENFRDAAYALQKVGDLAGPVKSVYGWHVIRAEKINPPQNRATDFSDPRYYDWIREEYETSHMQEWLKGMKAAAKITEVSTEDLLSIKSLKFNEK